MSPRRWTRRLWQESGRLLVLGGQGTTQGRDVDCLPNMDPASIRARMPGLVEILRAQRLSTPIFFVGDRLFGNAQFMPSRKKRQKDNTDTQREVFVELRNRGISGLRLVEKATWFGDGFEGSTDTVHANDIGALKIAESMEPVVRQLIGLAPAAQRESTKVSLI